MFLGEVLCSKNDQPEVVLMCVDHSQTLWGVFDIYGTTTQIVVSKTQLLSNVLTSNAQNVVVQSSQQPSTSYETMAAPASQTTVCYTPQPPMVHPNILEVNTDANGGTVLIVNLPAAQTNQTRHSPVMSSFKQQVVSARPPSVTIQQIQPRAAPVPEVKSLTVPHNISIF